MIQKIKKEIEKYLELKDITHRIDIIYNLSKLLQNHIDQNDIYNFKINCDDAENNRNNIDIYIMQYKYSIIVHLNIIYFGGKAKELRKLRKKKLEHIYGAT